MANELVMVAQDLNAVDLHTRCTHSQIQYLVFPTCTPPSKPFTEMGLASANIDGTIARWKAELLKNGLSDAKANSVVEVAIAFVEKYLMILTTKALHVEINRTAKSRSETRMDDGEVFVTSEASIQLIICNEICLASSAVGSPEGNRQLKVS